MQTLATLSPTSECTKQLVEQFCALAIRESSRVEYKREFPSNQSLAKSIAAFANGRGGLILIGVDADDENRPVRPICGMEFKRGYEERILQIATQVVYPPIIPTIWVAPFDIPPAEGSSKCVVVVRVDESSAAPHAVEDKKGIYVRSGSVSQPFYDLASVTQIEELLSRRQEAKQLPLRLESAFRARADYFYESFIEQKFTELPPGTSKPRAAEAFRDWAAVEVTCVPEFPTALLVSLTDLRQLYYGTTLLRYSPNGSHALMNSGSIRFCQDGIVEHSGGNFYQFAEFQEFGLFGYRETGLGEHRRMIGSPGAHFDPRTVDKVIDAIGTRGALLGVLEFLPRFYEALRFWGLLRISLTIRKAQGYRLMGYYGSDCSQVCPDLEVSATHHTTVQELDENLEAAYWALVERLHAAFGWGALSSEVLNEEVGKLRSVVHKHLRQ